MIAPLNDLARFYHEGEGNVGLLHFYQLLSYGSGVNLKPMQKKFLSKSGYIYGIHVVKVLAATMTTKRYKT